MESQPVNLAISSCLLGEAVRYNGGHKRSDFCADSLAPFVRFLPLCPEVAIGLGVPREPIRLVGDWGQPRAVGVKTPSLDVTAELLDYADTVKGQVANCHGYIFMKDSPSCGVYSTKVYTDKGIHLKKTSGLYAGRMLKHLPLLPVEEAGRLNDGALCENFITRVFLYHDWRVHLQPQARFLVAFHSRHKYLIMAYSQRLYRQLGHLVAQAGLLKINTLQTQYINELMVGTRRPPTRRGHVNALSHLVGYLRKEVPGAIRQDLNQAIDEYRLGQVPLSVPMKLMGHYLSHYGSDYIKQQSYLNPHPPELGLRNRI